MHVGADNRAVFPGRLTRHGLRHPGAGGHDQRPVGADKNRAERLDDTAIVLAVRHEFRKIVVEGQMDDAIRSGRALLETVQILERPAMNLGAGCSQLRRFLVRTTEAEHLMARRDQLLDDGRADESGRTGDEHTHDRSLQVSLETNLCSRPILVK